MHSSGYNLVQQLGLVLFQERICFLNGRKWEQILSKKGAILNKVDGMKWKRLSLSVHSISLLPYHVSKCAFATWGGGGGDGGGGGACAMVGKLSVPGHPAYLDNSRARDYCSSSRCRWGLFGHFFLLSIISLFFLPLWELAQYTLKYCLKGLLNPKETTNQPLQHE